MKIDNRPKRSVQGKGKSAIISKPQRLELSESVDKYIRQTYHIVPAQKKAIALMAAHEQLDKSEIVRQALDNYIPKKYIQMAILE